MNYLADIKLAPDGGFQGFGPLGLEGKTPALAGVVFNKFLSSTVGVMTIIAVIWFIFSLIGGAIGFMSAGGDKQQLESAKKKITTGIIGLVIIVASLFILKLIGAIIGIDFILDPAYLIDVITK